MAERAPKKLPETTAKVGTADQSRGLVKSDQEQGQRQLLGVYTVEPIDDGANVFGRHTVENFAPGDAHVRANFTMAQANDGIDDDIQIACQGFGFQLSQQAFGTPGRAR